MSGAYEPTPPTAADEAAQLLESLPSLEEAQRQVQAAVEDIKAAVGRIIPGVIWQSNTDTSGLRSQCPKPYDQSKGGYFLLLSGHDRAGRHPDPGHPPGGVSR